MFTIKSPFKKVISMTFVFIFIFCNLIPINAYTASNSDDIPVWFYDKMSEFFGDQRELYCFFDNQNNDMTDQFYEDNLLAYQNQEISYIYEYFLNYIKRIEKTVITESAVSRAEGDVTVNVSKDFTENFETRADMSGYRCTLNWTMTASYVKNELYAGGAVVSTTKPVLGNFAFSNVGPTGVPQITGYETYHSISGNYAEFGFYIDMQHGSLLGGAYENYPRYTWSDIFG